METITTQGIAIQDKNSKTTILAALIKIFPDNQGLAAIAQNDTDIADASKHTSELAVPVKPIDTPASRDQQQHEFCEALARELADLQNSEKALSDKLEDERTGRNGSLKGFGRVAVAIEQQVKSANAAIADAKFARTSKGC
jgi:hypothetical protein